MNVFSILPLLLIASVKGFNIETKFIDVVSVSRTQPGSYFGFALDFVTHGSKSWLVIGAPKLNDVSAGNRTGGLYKRDVLSRGAPAELMDVFNRASNQPNVNQGRDHMWFGGSMAAAENSVTACAPRWINKINSSEYYMNGLCYVIPSGYFAETRFITPRVRSLLNQFPDKQHIAPDPDRQNMTWEYGLGTAGLSVIYNLSSQTQEHTIYGAPGVNEFTGGAISFQTDNDVQVHGQNLGAAYESKMFGYALAMGMFYGGAESNKEDYYLAVGGPRASGTGEVLILQHDYTLHTRLHINEPGSYFGSSLCAVQRTSVSSETLLLVGAPMYSKLTKYNKFYTSTVEQGAVFVYRLAENQADAIQMLQSSTTAKSRFGMAMSDLGDINGDDFHDVVIGAPFEEDQKGVIYIYNGYKNGFLETQRIVGNDMDTSLRGYFGYSFAQNNINFNGDKSNELAVGAFMSDSAVILFTQPVIAMQVTARQSTNLTTIGDPDMTIRACFKYTGDSTILPGDVNVDYKIRADVEFSGRTKRVCMVNGQYCDYEVMERNQQIPGFNFDPKCLTPFTVRLTDTQEIRELFIPIVFSIQFNISDANACTRNICPVINRFYGNLDNPTTREVKAATVDLKKNGCGADNLCQTYLTLQSVDVKYHDSENVLILGPKSKMTVDVTVRVSNEPSYNTKIRFLCDQELSYVRSIDVGSQIGMKCSVIRTPFGRIEIECDTNPSQLGVESGSEIKVSLEFDARLLKPNIKSFKFEVEVVTKSINANIGQNRRTLYIPVKAKVDGAFDRLAAPEVYVTKKDREEFETMKHIITFFNRGPSNIDDNTTFTVTYPSGRIGGKWVVSVVEGVMNISNAQPDLQVSCNTKTTMVTDGDSSSYKDFRAISFNTMNSTSEEDMNAQYDCTKPGGSCHMVKCTVRPIPADSYVLFRLVYSVDPKLYHRAGGQDPSVKSVDLVSKVDVQLPASVTATMIQNDNFAKTEVLPSKQKAEPIPSWIIVLAVVAALLVIGIIVLILWKCGFFKRKDKEKLLERQKEEEEDKDGTANPAIKVTPADDQIQEEFDPLVQNGDKKISMPDAPDAQGETEDWGEIDELLGDLDEEKTSPDDVKVHIEDAAVKEKGNGEMEYAQVRS